MVEEPQKQWNPPWWSLVVFLWGFAAAVAAGGALADWAGFGWYLAISMALAPFCAMGLHLAIVAVKYPLRSLLDWAIYDAHLLFGMLYPVEEWLKWRIWNGARDKYRVWTSALLALWLGLLVASKVLPQHVTCDNWYGPLLLCFSFLFLVGPWTVRPVAAEELAALERNGASSAG